MAESIHDAICNRLALHLGPNVAKMAIKGFLKKAGIATADALTRAHVPALVEEIRPMLNVMIGKDPTNVVLADIARLG